MKSREEIFTRIALETGLSVRDIENECTSDEDLLAWLKANEVGILVTYFSRIYHHKIPWAGYLVETRQILELMEATGHTMYQIKEAIYIHKELLLPWLHNDRIDLLTQYFNNPYYKTLSIIDSSSDEEDSEDGYEFLQELKKRPQVNLEMRRLNYKGEDEEHTEQNGAAPSSARAGTPVVTAPAPAPKKVTVKLSAPPKKATTTNDEFVDVDLGPTATITPPTLTEDAGWVNARPLGEGGDDDFISIL